MTTASDEYEKFIAGLVRDISATHRDIEFLGYGTKCRLKGVLGQNNQIDVAFIDRTFPTPKLVLIECKLNNPKYHVGPEVVKILYFNGLDLHRYKDTDSSLLIICSTSILSTGAQRLTEALKIKHEHVSNTADFTFRYEDILLAGVGAALIVLRTNSVKGPSFHEVGSSLSPPTNSRRTNRVRPDIRAFMELIKCPDVLPDPMEHHGTPWNTQSFSSVGAVGKG